MNNKNCTTKQLMMMHLVLRGTFVIWERGRRIKAVIGHLKNKMCN
jgi:hypothetical protein